MDVSSTFKSFSEVFAIRSTTPGIFKLFSQQSFASNPSITIYHPHWLLATGIMTSTHGHGRTSSCMYPQQDLGLDLVFHFYVHSLHVSSRKQALVMKTVQHPNSTSTSVLEFGLEKAFAIVLSRSFVRLVSLSEARRHLWDVVHGQKVLKEKETKMDGLLNFCARELPAHLSFRPPPPSTQVPCSVRLLYTPHLRSLAKPVFVSSLEEGLSRRELGTWQHL